MYGTVSKGLSHLWYPYTQMKDLESTPPVLIERGQGLRLYDRDGNEYLDAISSWWCNLHGHNHPEVMTAIREQSERLDHVLFAGFTHSPGITLAEKLLSVAPRSLQRVFFSDNGSTAVEAALKMSLQYWKNIGNEKKVKFASLDKGYHGDTCGAMSVGGRSVFTRNHEEMLFDTVSLPAPYCYRCPYGEDRRDCAFECITGAEKILCERAEELAGLIIEPLVMGAGGIIIYPVEYLSAMREITERLNIHLIADEVATGFMRTGRFFACEHGNVSPEFMCLSKSITSGAMALGATLTTEEIFSSFYDVHTELKTFYHGHTFTANPIACSAANASLDILIRERPDNKVEKIHRRILSFLEEMSSTSLVGDTRAVGLIGAMELVRDKQSKERLDPAARTAYRISAEALKEGLILRPLGEVLYFFLPLCVTDDDLELIFDRTRKAFDRAGAL